VGNAPGANAGPITSAESRSALPVTKRLRRSLVGRLLDTFDKDLRGVSALQQSCARSAVLPVVAQRKCSEGMGATSPIPIWPSAHHSCPWLGLSQHEVCRGGGL